MDELVELVQIDFTKSGDIKSLLNLYTDQIRSVQEEFKIEGLIPPDHNYWKIQSKIVIAQEMYSEGMLPRLEPPLNNKQTFRMLKYGRGHLFNRKD